MSETISLAHAGVKGMKWGIRKESKDSGSSNQKSGLSDRQKTALKVGLGVAAVGVASVAGRKWMNSPSGMKTMKSAADRINSQQAMNAYQYDRAKRAAKGYAAPVISVAKMTGKSAKFVGVQSARATKAGARTTARLVTAVPGKLSSASKTTVSGVSRYITEVISPPPPPKRVSVGKQLKTALKGQNSQMLSGTARQAKVAKNTMKADKVRIANTLTDTRSNSSSLLKKSLSRAGQSSSKKLSKSTTRIGSNIVNIPANLSKNYNRI